MCANALRLQVRQARITFKGAKTLKKEEMHVFGMVEPEEKAPKSVEAAVLTTSTPRCVSFLKTSPPVSGDYDTGFAF